MAVDQPLSERARRVVLLLSVLPLWLLISRLESGVTDAASRFAPEALLPMPLRVASAAELVALLTRSPGVGPVRTTVPVSARGTALSFASAAVDGETPIAAGCCRASELFDCACACAVSKAKANRLSERNTVWLEGVWAMGDTSCSLEIQWFAGLNAPARVGDRVVALRRRR